MGVTKMASSGWSGKRVQEKHLPPVICGFDGAADDDGGDK